MERFSADRYHAIHKNHPFVEIAKIVLVGVGAGLSYSNSGYTHHAVEDLAIMRTLPHMKIFQPCDNASTKIMADLALESSSPIYLRLDRYGKDNVIGDTSHVAEGMTVLRPIEKITLLASGNMVLTALTVNEMLAEKNIRVGVVDACILPLNANRFSEILSGVEKLIVLEEHNLDGGLGSHVLERISDLELNLKVKRFGLDLTDGYIREYGGRDLIHRQQGIDAESIANYILEENK